MKQERAVLGVGVVLLLLGAVAAFVVLRGIGDETVAPTEAETEAARRERRRSQPEAAPAAAPAVPDPEPAPLAPAPPPPPSGEGLLQGVLVDAVDGNAVAGARVEVLRFTGAPVADTVTDDAGRYRLTLLPHETPLVVRLSSPGYLTGVFGDVSLPAGAALRKDARLLRMPEVRLRLETAKGEPPDPAQVMLSANGRMIAVKRSDESGQLHLAVPGFGEYELRIGGAVYAAAPSEVIRFTPGSGDVELERRVDLGGRLEVLVQRPDGSPVQAARVILAGEGLAPRTDASDSFGRSVFERVPPRAALEIVAELETEQLRGRATTRVTEGGERQVTVKLTQGTSVGGRVHADGVPLAGATVTVRLPGGAVERAVTTDAEGRFGVTGVPAGALLVSVAGDGYATWESRLDGEPETEVDLDVPLERRRPAVIRGFVLDPLGAPIPDATVRLEPAGRSETSDMKGRFRFDNAPLDTQQRLVASADRFVPSAAGSTHSRAFTLREGAWIGVELVLQPEESDEAPAGETEAMDPAGIVVRGLIRDRRARPVYGAVVAAAGVSTETGPDGTFALPGVVFEEGAASPTLILIPPPGLLVRQRHVIVAPPAGEDLDVGVIELAARPVALLRIVPPGERDPELAVVAALATNLVDEALGRLRAPGEPQVVVTYDGVWPHLPARDALQIGAGRIWVGIAGPRGLAVASEHWRLRPNLVATVRMELGDALTQARITVPKTYIGGRLELRMESATEDVTDGSAANHVLRTGLPRGFAVRATEAWMDLDDLPRGRWSVRLGAPRGSGLEPLETEFDTETTTGRITFDLKKDGR